MEISGFFFLLLLSPTIAWAQSTSSGLPSLSQGSSLTILDKKSNLMVSSEGTFSAGFYLVGTNAYCFSIWFTKSSSKTVVWMANRDRPVGKNSKLTLHKNGNLILTDYYGSIVWSTGTLSNGAVELRLHETGNLVMTNEAKRVIWESFDFPTDTLLPLQPLVKNTTLVSMKSKGTYLSGVYNFKFTDDNALKLIYNGPLLSSIYWPDTSIDLFQNGRTPYNSTRIAILNQIGEFISSDNLLFNASDYGFGPRRRITLDYDGILRLYSLNESNGLWEISWFHDGLDACRVHGLCGEYGICTYNKLPTCSCPYGFIRKDPSDSSKGCSPSFNLTNISSDKLDFIEIRNTDYFGYDLQSYASGVPFETCRNSCLTDSNCKGFGYGLDGTAECFPKSRLLNGNHMPSSRRTMHLKVLKEIVLNSAQQKTTSALKSFTLNCSVTPQFSLDNSEVVDEEKNNKNGYMKYLIAFVGSFAVIEVTFIGLGWWFIFRKHANDDLTDMGYIALAMGFKRFTFKELKKATKNFKQEIGRGGFGTVYKGILDDERVVAVKRLEGVLQGDTEFWAEVSIIGNINHRNLVKLWGFCAENEHKLLVYEYVEKGSLDKYLFSSESSSVTLGLDQRYKIALGTAKGLSYLHEECLEWVLHCDVKPQNILLDENFEPIVSDFGLSKLFKETQDVGFSRVRGTRGYLAPEWMMNMTIDAKADVYSYGIVLLELLSGKSASGFVSAPTYGNQLFNQLVKWVSEKIKTEGLKEVIDPRLIQEFNEKKLDRLIEVAMLCVQEDRNARPAMSKVVELLLQIDEQA